MSEILAVQFFENGVSLRIPRATIWNIFQKYAKNPTTMGWDLLFPDGSSSCLSLDDDDQVDGFGIIRPCGGMIFDLIYSALSKLPAIMIMSSSGRCCVADEKVIRAVPDWLLRALPQPKIVGSGMDIIKAIEAS